MKKIIPSICMLLVTAVLMGTSTYAWFSMNRKVEVNGMKVTASTSANLVITDTPGAEFSSVDSFNVTLPDTITELAPVSSKDGKLFYTTEAAAKGNTGFDVEDGAEFTKVENAGTSTAKYYYTKTVYIGVKGVNGLGQLKVEPQIGTSTKHGGVAEKNDIYKALRIAVFAKDQNSTVFAGDLSSRANWNPIVKAGKKGTDTGLTEAGTTTAVTKGTGVALAGLAKLEKEVWYEINIFVWLDGQDEACTANNANIANVNIANLTIDFVFTAENAA